MAAIPNMLKKLNVDENVCADVAELLRRLPLRASFYDRPFLRIKAETELKLRGYFFAVAICHQTYTLHNKALNLYGWDYLEYAFHKLIAANHNFLQPGHLSEFPKNQIIKELAEFFSPDSDAVTSTLDRIDERVDLLLELEKFVDQHFQSSYLNLVTSTSNYLINNNKGYYEILPITSAFSDPLKKKITFLLKLLEEADLIAIQDPEHFIPIMDYHMQRVLMRLGCVQINDEELKNNLINRNEIDDDTEVRSACIRAFEIISRLSGYPVTKMNDFFWSLGRSCCNESPLCEFHSCEKTPCTFFEIVDLKEHKDCYFKSCCKGYRDSSVRKLWQPVIQTHYY